MKPEMSERLFIEDLFRQSVKDNKIEIEKIESIERLTGDASTRRYYRVFCTKISYVVCLDNPSQDDNDFVKKQNFFHREKIRVPLVLDSNPSKGYILEEDLGDQTLIQEMVNIESLSQEFDIYKKIIDELIKIHKTSPQKIEDSQLFNLKFDFTKYMEEIDFSLRYFYKKFLKIKELAPISKLNTEFEKICREISSRSMVLTHRDFHSRNIMVKNGELIIIDFQDARMGIPQYDLASLLDDCYYELNMENKEKLLLYYYDEMKDKLEDQSSFEEFKRLYDLVAIQRVFKAIGSFSYIFEHRKDERYVKYIGFAMEKIKKIMLANPDYNELRKTLFGSYYAS